MKNITVSVSTRPAEAGKAAASVGLLGDEDLCLSSQVLQECRDYRSGEDARLWSFVNDAALPVDGSYLAQ